MLVAAIQEQPAHPHQWTKHVPGCGDFLACHALNVLSDVMPTADGLLFFSPTHMTICGNGAIKALARLFPKRMLRCSTSQETLRACLTDLLRHVFQSDYAGGWQQNIHRKHRAQLARVGQMVPSRFLEAIAQRRPATRRCRRVKT